MSVKNFKRFSTKNILINSIISIIYLGFNIFFSTIRPEHLFLVFLWWFMFYLSEKTRRFALAYSIFIIFWILYDSMRVIPNYTVNSPHIKEPYEIEKQIFGIYDKGVLKTPNEYFALHSHKVLDFLSGFFYINWMPVPLLFGFYLFLRKKKVFVEFGLAFLLVNILGFIIYYLYPAAPPWYVSHYGFAFQEGIPGNRAGLARFDRLINYPLFKNIYNKNANVLAAMPSLHATYPLIVLYYGIKAKLPKYINFLFAVLMLGIWFAAVYSNHHYIIDVLCGVILALIVLTVFNKLLQKNKHLKQFINNFSNLI